MCTNVLSGGAVAKWTEVTKAERESESESEESSDLV